MIKKKETTVCCFQKLFNISIGIQVCNISCLFMWFNFKDFNNFIDQTKMLTILNTLNFFYEITFCWFVIKKKNNLLNPIKLFFFY